MTHSCRLLLRCCGLAALLLLLLLLLLLPCGAAAQDAPPGCLVSSRFPIRLCAVQDADAAFAATLMTLAESGWQTGVVELGLTPPWRLDDHGVPEQGLALELADRPGGPAKLEPLADVPATPSSDCAVRILVSRRSHGQMGQMQLLYDMLLAMQDADDCAEPLTPFIPFALYLHLLEAAGLGTVGESVQWMNDYYFATFQAYPDLALDYSTQSVPELATYEFGEALFAMYLDERWGQGDGKLLAQISLAGRQDGQVVIQLPQPALASGANEPDLFDAVDTVLAPLGGSFRQAVEEFSIWRFFTGAYADPAHLKYGSLLREVAFDAAHTAAELPLVGQAPARAPQETGTVYLDLDLVQPDVTSAARAQQRLVFELRSSGGEGWYLAALAFQADGTVRQLDGEFGGGQGRLLVDGLEQVQHVVFVVNCQGDGVHDPDDHDWDAVAFQYDLRLVLQPQADGVTPQQLRQGERNVSLFVAGSGFEAGIVADLGPGIVLRQLVQDRAGDRLALVVDVAADAPTGWHALALQDGLGLSCGVAQAVEVLPGVAPELLALSPASGAQGRSVTARLFGRHLQPGARLAVLGSAGVTVSSLVVQDEQELEVGLAVAADAPAGPRDLELTNPDGQRATLAGGFSVLAAAAGPDSSAGTRTAAVDDSACRLVPSTARPPWACLLLALGLLPRLRPARRWLRRWPRPERAG